MNTLIKGRKWSSGILAVGMVVVALTGIIVKQQASAATCTITFDNGGGDYRWENPTNWDSDTLPTGTDHACIGAQAQPVAVMTDTHDVGSLASDAALTVQGGTLNLTNTSVTSTINGQLTLITGTLGGNADVEVNAPFVHQGGTLRGTGSFTTLNGNDVTFETSALKTVIERQLVSGDQVIWTLGSVSIQGGANLTAQTSVELNNTGNSTMTGNTGSRLTTPQLNKNTSTTVILNIVFTNTGNVNVAAGSLNLRRGDGGQAHTGTFTGGGGLTLEGSHNLQSTATVATGNVTIFSAADTVIDSDFNIGNVMHVGSSSPTFNGNVTTGGPLNITGGGLPVYNGTVDVGGSISISINGHPTFNGTTTAASGGIDRSNIEVNGTLTTANYFQSLGGQIRGTGTLNTQTVRLWQSSLAPLTTIDSLTLNTVTINFPSHTTELVNGAVFNIDNFSISGSSTRTMTGDGTGKINAGALNYGVTPNTTIAVPIEIDGPVDMTTDSTLSLTEGSGGGEHSGNWQLPAGRTLALGGEHRFDNATSITGSGALSLVGGTFHAPRSTSVGTFAMNAASMLVSEINGTDAGAPAGYDNVDASTGAALGGTLKVVTSETYTPADGSVHDVVTGPVTGTFASSQGLTDLSWGEWLLSYTASAARLTANVTRPPLANNLNLSTPEDTPVTGQVSGTDPAGRDLTFHLSLVDGPTNGTITAWDEATGKFTYAPNTGFVGTDSFKFLTFNGANYSEEPGTVVIEVTPVNKAPVAADLQIETAETVPVTATLPATDPDGDTLTFSLSDMHQPAHGVIMAFDPLTGQFTYVPFSGYSGTDSFKFVASDGELTSNEGTVTVTIQDVNFSPVAGDLSVETDENTPVTATVTATDADGDPLTYHVAIEPGHGTVEFTDNSNEFTYTPDPGFFGEDSFTYQANDGTADSNLAVVTITVNWVNPLPTTPVIQPPINADGSSVFNANRGIVPVKWKVGSTCGKLPPATIQIQRIGTGGEGDTLNQEEFSSESDGGTNYRVTSDCQYHYNLRSKNLGAGEYQVSILIDGHIVASAIFKLK